MALQKCFQVEEESWKETEWQPKKKYERMSGSQKERNRLAAIERVQGKASGYERQVQKLSAIGEARFKRMQVRKGRRDQGAPPTPRRMSRMPMKWLQGGVRSGRTGRTKPTGCKSSRKCSTGKWHGYLIHPGWHS